MNGPTATAIQSMTDPGGFEILVVQSLRFLHCEFRSVLEHRGVNAAGKTIKGPVDAFGVVTVNGRRTFVFVACTTDADPDSKLLQDLRKASGEAAKLRKNKDDHFVVVLATNRELTNSASLVREGERFGIEVRFVTNSILRDFLDLDRDGQYIRKERLGIECQRISRSLFSDIAIQTLHEYAPEFRWLADPKDFVETDNTRHLNQMVTSGTESVLLILDDSGRGKSVLAYQALQYHLASGYPGIRISEVIVKDATSLSDAIYQTLRIYEPNLEAAAGIDVLSDHFDDQPLLIVIDDVNRLLSTEAIVKKLVEWFDPGTHGISRENHHRTRAAQLIVPCWNRHWLAIKSGTKKPGWVSEFFLAELSENDAVAIIRRALGEREKSYPAGDLADFASRLAYDPTLLTMFGRLVSEYPHDDPPRLIQDVFEMFIERKVSHALPAHILPEHALAALQNVAAMALVERTQSISMSSLLSSLAEKEVEALAVLCKTEVLCRFEQGQERVFRFRHDRIFGYFAVRALANRLRTNRAKDDLFADPYYAEYVGEALCIAGSSLEISQLEEMAPLALIAALIYLEENNPICMDVLNAVKSVLEKPAPRDSVRSYIYWYGADILRRARSEFVLSVTESQKANPVFSQARFGAGDAYAGVIALGRERIWFQLNDSRLDRIIEQANNLHHPKLVRGCKLILARTDLSDWERYGVLILAGLLAHPSLTSLTLKVWAQAHNRSELLPNAIWAMLRCGGKGLSTDIQDPLNDWLELPLQVTNDRVVTSPRGRVTSDIAWAMRFGLGRQGTQCLVRKARQVIELRREVAEILDDVRTEETIEFVVKYSAETGRRQIRPWHPKWVRPSLSRKRSRDAAALSVEHLEKLQGLSVDPHKSKWFREGARHLWLLVTPNIAELRSVSDSNPEYRSVIMRRASLHDTDAVQEVVRLAQTDWRFWALVPKVWSREAYGLVDQELSRIGRARLPRDTDAISSLAAVIRAIPTEDGEALLEKHWKRLRGSRMFLQTALYFAREPWLNRVAEALKLKESVDEPLRHITWTFGFRQSGLDEQIEPKHLYALQPYLAQLEWMELHEVSYKALKHGMSKWSQEHVLPEYERRLADRRNSETDRILIGDRMRIDFPTDEDLIKELDHLTERSGRTGCYMWARRFDAKRDPPDRMGRLLANWLRADPSAKRLSMVAAALEVAGTRADLTILDEPILGDDYDEIAEIRARTKLAVRRKSL